MMRYFLPVFLVLLMGAYGSACARQVLTLNTAANPPYHYPDQSGGTDLLAREAFGRIGLAVVIQGLPAERALMNADAGIEDGDCGRIAGLDALYPHLIQVPEPFLVTDFVAFTKQRDLTVRSWQDLQPLDVGIVRGHKICEKMVQGTQSLTTVDSVALLFTLLEKDRVDVVICERVFGAHVVKGRGLDGAVRIMEPPLATLDFFIYLHKRHEAIVPALARSLKEMRGDGTYDRILQEGLLRPAPAGNE